MNFRNFKAAVVSLVLLSSALLWLGCQNPSQGPKAAPGTSSNQQDGTTDGGGGNGLNNRPLDSYIVNPYELGAYKNHLAHMFETRDAKSSRKLLPRDLFKAKNWYLADVKLKPIENESLGLSFTDDFTQQMALQTSRAIWINSAIFEKMDEKEQAKLLLHEYVMAAYFFKFMKMSDFCKAFQYTKTEKTNCDNVEIFDDILLPKKLVPLGFHDYENIRGMTSWLWNNWKTATDEDVARELMRYDFDSRTLVSIFKKPEQREAEEQKTLPMEAVADLIEKAILLNKAPTECRGLNTQLTVGCKLQIAPIKIPSGYEGHDLAGFKFTARTAEGNTVLEETMYGIGNGYISKFEDPVARKMYYLIPLATMNLGVAVKGQKFRMNSLILSVVSPFDKEPQYELSAIISIASVVTKVHNEPPPGPLEAFKGFKGMCWGDRPQATSMADDVVAIVQPGTETAYFRWFANNIRGLSAPCANGFTTPSTAESPTAEKPKAQ